MLKINNVSYDICTKGPAISHPTLILDFEPVESYDGDLFEDFKKLLEKENLIDVYNEAINYKQNIYFLFRGRIFQKENIPIYQDLFEKISKESANIQKPLLDAHKININQMKPPFFMWEGIPEDFTGIENAYTDFNVPYAIISKDTGYSPIALQQILNNPFGSVFIEWNDDAPELYKDIEEMFHGIKSFLMASPEKYEEAKKFALENKCCLYKNNA
jgi:hypothetical protein